MKKITILILILYTLFIPFVHQTYATSSQVAETSDTLRDASPSHALEPNTEYSNQRSKEEYILPYPGILPDHPLYAFKNIRDSILELLISDPLRKIEFYILQSDKEVSASQFLTINNKTSFLKHTVEHAVVFKQKAITLAKLIKSQGKEVPGFLIERLTNSVQKQADILGELDSSDNDLKQIISESKTKVSTFQADIDTLKK